MRFKALYIIKRLNKYGYQAYLVGGCVRDMLLNKTVKDFDITTNATPSEIKAIFGESVTCGNNFLVSIVDGIEVATFRTDLEDKAIKSETLQEDVIRRDFTINGLAMDINYNIIDHVNGEEDIYNRVLRFIGEPNTRIKEDNARILRGIRFMAVYNLTPSYDTHFALLQNKDLIRNLPKERIQKEVIKAFSTDKAYRFVQLLREYEMLKYVFPSIYNLVGLNGGHHHNETVYTHCLNALKSVDFTSVPYKTKLACLYHDTGKKDTMQITNDRIRFCGHQEESKQHAIQDFTSLKFSNKDIEYISNLCEIHMFHVLERDGETVNKKRVKKLMVELAKKGLTLKDFAIMRYADNHANMLKVRPFKSVKNQYKQMLKILKEPTPFSVKNLDITGFDVMNLGVEQGKKVGEILNILFELVLNQELENKKDILIEKVKDLI